VAFVLLVPMRAAGAPSTEEIVGKPGQINVRLAAAGAAAKKRA